MKKVLYVNQFPDDATSFYRIQSLVYLNGKSISLTKLQYGGNITWESFTGYEILFMERPSSSHDLNLIKLAKLCGLKIFIDFDDDCLHVPVTNPMWHHYQQCKQVVMECLALADEVWVSTSSLKKAYSLLNSNIHVIPNAHNDYLFKLENKKPFNHETKKVIWRGGQSHEADVYESADQLIKVINDNSDWKFQFMGCRFIYMELKCGDNYQPVSLIPLMNYFEYMQKENPNIVIHPLQNNRFNESKSNIAWLEATYVGAAFCGNKSLPEFNLVPMLSIEFLAENLSENLQKPHDMAWEYICDNLLLSKVNSVREERVLAI